MKQWLKRTGIAAAVGALAIFGATELSYAQTSTGDTAPAAISSQANPAQFQERVENGQRPNQGRRGPRASERLAEALNMTVEELRAELQSGKTVEEIAAEQGVDLEALKAEHQAEAIARVQQRLADGEITQEQADRIIERIENGERPGPGGPRRGAGGGGPRGR